MLQLTFGMRHASVDNDFTDSFSFPAGETTDDDITVAELGVAYRLNDRTRITARYDQNFRFAKVNELALAAPGEILDNQTGESYELGIDVISGKHQVVASIYRLDLEDEIEFDPDAGLFGQNVNLDDTRRNGITLALLSQVSPNFVMTTEIGYVDAEFRSGTFNGNKISGVSDQVAKLRGDLLVSDYVTTYLEVNYSSPRYAQGDNANEFGKLDSIKVYNAGASYRHKTWEMGIRINNLTDEDYAEFVTNAGAYYPSPERNFMISVGYGFE